MFVLAVRAMLATVLTVAAVGKVRNRQAFGEFAAWVQTLPAPGARARPLPVLAVAAEASIAAGMGLGVTTPYALVASGLLFTVFAAAVQRVHRRGLVVECLCFGAERGQLGLMHASRDGLLAVAAFAAALMQIAAFHVQPGLAESYTAIVLGLILAGFVISLENIVALTIGPSRDLSV